MAKLGGSGTRNALNNSDPRFPLRRPLRNSSSLPLRRPLNESPSPPCGGDAEGRGGAPHLKAYLLAGGGPPSDTP